jgi:4a-hydroxytetrahydrobiopterin dehydratase
MEELSQKKCKACEGGVQPFTLEQTNEYLPRVNGWELVHDGKAVKKNFLTKNFMAAVTFIHKIADVAEAEDHHPDIHLVGYRKLTIELSTHAVGGLSENDFILAAKIDQLPVELKT